MKVVGKQIMMSLYLSPEQRQGLERLSNVTRVPMQTYLREAVDDLLVKYRKELKKEPKR
jgi:predicted DNA-binding protein